MRSRWSTAALAVALLVPGPALAQAPEAVVVFDGEALGWKEYRVSGRGGPWFDALHASPVDGSVWAATHLTLIRFRGTHREEFRNGDLQAELGAYCGDFKPLAFDAQGTLWLRLWCSGPDDRSNLATFDGTSWKVFRYTGPGAHGLQSARMPHSLATAPNGVLHFTYHGYGRVRRAAAEAFEAAPCPRGGQVPGYSEGVVYREGGVLLGG